ncbi:hypothetical protein EV385_3413 [Krasilnikovia cinnamomea]|uniref:Uncharacterized protein n=2 Tax=Krasilnikovia cinnamomea TaxID=349313 RepID=A0A4Q7ZME5_9ACTN|nr:hypothetical protein EV385_3413 [Krasilnikovia cinnamomea]
MTEPGWPLIPRELLPAPVPAAGAADTAVARHRVGGPRAVDPHDAGRQLSIFGVEATDPSPADLAGLLAGPGHLGRMGGTARVSVRVDAAWRVHVLAAELIARGLAVTWFPLPDREPLPDEPPTARPGGVAGFEVRTAYSSRLNGLARSWPPPADGLFLDGARLRLWVAAAGTPSHGGYLLGLGVTAGQDRDTVEAALSRAGLAPVLSDDGLGFVISGRKRLSRLAELVGDRPAAAPVALWPGGATS